MTNRDELFFTKLVEAFTEDAQRFDTLAEAAVEHIKDRLGDGDSEAGVDEDVQHDIKDRLGVVDSEAGVDEDVQHDRES